MNLVGVRHTINTKWTTYLLRYPAIFASCAGFISSINGLLVLRNVSDIQDKRIDPLVHWNILSAAIACFVLVVLSRSLSLAILLGFLLLNLGFTIFNYEVQSHFSFGHMTTIGMCIFVHQFISTIACYRHSWKLSKKGISEATPPRMLEKSLRKTLSILVLPPFCMMLIIAVCMPFTHAYLRVVCRGLILCCVVFYVLMLLGMPVYVLVKPSGYFGDACRCSLSNWYNDRLCKVLHVVVRATASAVAKMHFMFIGLFTLQFAVVVILLAAQLSVSFLFSEYTFIHENKTVTFPRGPVINYVMECSAFLVACAVLALLVTQNFAFFGIFMATLLNSVCTSGIMAMGMFPMQVIELFLVTLLSFTVSFDTNLKFAVAYKYTLHGSRKARAKAALLFVLSSLVVPCLVSLAFFLSLAFFIQQQVCLMYAAVVFWNLILQVFYAPSLLMVFGPTEDGWLCGDGRGSHMNSELTDRFASLHNIDDTRRFSSVNYTGFYKKRTSLQVAPSVRRASMPVVALANSKHSTPGCSSRKFSTNTYAGRRGMSVDGVSLASGNRAIKRKEPLEQSQHSLASQPSVDSQQNHNQPQENL